MLRLGSSITVRVSVWFGSVFYAVFGCQNDTLKLCKDILNSESLDMVLLCIEV